MAIDISELSADHRLLLQAVAVAWHGLTQADLLEFARELGLRAPDGKAWTTTTFPVLRDELVERRLIEKFRSPFLSGFQIAEVALRERLTRAAIDDSVFEQIAALVEDVLPAPLRDFNYGSQYEPRVLRNFRIALYRGDEDALAKFEKRGDYYLIGERLRGIFVARYSFPFQADALAATPVERVPGLLPSLYRMSVEYDDSTAPFWSFVDENGYARDSELRVLRATEHLFRADLAGVAKLLGEPDSAGEMFIAAVAAILEGADAAGAEQFHVAIEALRRVHRKKKLYPNDWTLFLYAVALLRVDQTRFLQFAAEAASFFGRDQADDVVPEAVRLLAAFASETSRRGRVAELPPPYGFGEHLILVVLAALVPEVAVIPFLDAFEKACVRHGFVWPLHEIANLRRGRDLPRLASTPADGEEPPVVLVGRRIARPDAWERRLNALLAAAEQVAPAAEAAAAKKKKPANETRVVWLVDPDERDVKPVEQKLQNGKWSGGRPIALKRLHDDKVENLTERDRAVVKDAVRRSYNYFGNNYDVIFGKAIVALAGHPHVFLMEDPEVRINLVLTEPTLTVAEVPEGFEVRFDVEFYGEGTFLRRESATIYHVVRAEQKHARIAETLRSERLVVPKEGRPKLVEATQKLASVMNVRSDLGEDLELLPPIEPDLRVRVLITPTNDWFRVELFSKPFGSSPPFFRPGVGALNVATEIDGERRRTQRDHVEERERALRLVGKLPSLDGAQTGEWDWELGGVGPLLATLAELEAPRAAGEAVVEWTGGKPVQYRGRVDYGNVKVQIRRPLKVHGKGWFDFDAYVRVDEKLVIPLRDLARRLGPEARGYVELDDGQFLALSERLRKKLAELATALDAKGRIHQLQSGLIDELEAEAAEFEADESWRAHVRRLREAESFAPVVPPTFDAELRPYQVEGYNWLARLAHLGLGACLADDMGLGKTLQALALMVDRAPMGPQLVVAPVSVCRNWLAEARRFAPTLRFALFAEADDRAAQVDALGAFDVVVASYNLLQSNAELFASRKFATVVLDEAQAIKNRGTQRSKAAMALDADFRLLTTGTPIENNLAELWNLFNFINPGLLGGYDYFYDRFAVPIERDRSESARRTLHKLIAPFILRRRKSEVLDELPPKTEIVLSVELTPDERAQYEAVRREAAERIEKGIDPDMRFQILAELTKLRLASCHPRLAGGKAAADGGGGGKLDLFGATVEELIAGRHRALVFSQFVKHLELVREYLDKRGIVYQYLDGSTPPAKRQQAIDAFQRGVGELFLISLRAGGTGLNLTAADYVIHLDPWWNPAVEDQATDRAHRIGQTRPVTVYRLVAAGTVEEKILKLHESKRELADSLLDETSAAGTLSVEELRELILR